MLRLLLLPLRAPMLLVLFLVSLYLGLHWTDVASVARGGGDQGLLVSHLFWPLQTLQAVLLVILCTMPDLLMRELSLLMSASKVLTLVVTLLLVITGGLYLMHLSVFSEVLVMASAILLARLDLVRLRIVPAPAAMALGLSLWMVAGIALGRALHGHLDPFIA